MLFRLRPWRFDPDECVEVVEDLVRFVVYLAVDLEKYESLGVVVCHVFVFFMSAAGFGVEDQAVDVFADLGREGEEV